MDKLKMHSPDMTQENIKKIQALFPNCVTEARDENGKLRLAIDFDQLKQELSDSIVEGPQERYHLNWPGKREALLAANAPTSKTLRPCLDKSFDFDNTSNLFVEGDNLEALKILQESYLGKVKVIYIDPPYNTGKDFVYRDDYSTSAERYSLDSNEASQSGEKLVVNTTSNGRFHSTWLTMIYPRLLISRRLLREDGAIFISIDDNELHNLKKICDEIYGSSNFVATLVWANKEGGGSSDSRHFRVKHEYCLCYAKSIEDLKIKGVPVTNRERYKSSDEHCETRGPYYLQKLGMGSIQYSKSLDYEIKAPDGTSIWPKDNNQGKRACWRWSKDKLDWGFENGFIEIKKDSKGIWTVYTKQYLNCDNEGKLIERTQAPLGIIDGYSSTQAAKYLDKLNLGNYFDYSKPFKLIEWLLERVVGSDDIVMDFFAGSGTTAQAVMEMNAKDNGRRRFILVQLPEEIKTSKEIDTNRFKSLADVAMERIRAVGRSLTHESNTAIDIGFRCFYVDESNFTSTEKAPESIRQTELDIFIENKRAGRGALDILFETLLSSGLDISLNIESKDLDDYSFYSVDNSAVIACLQEGLSESLLTEILKEQPIILILSSDAFDNSDSSLINAGQLAVQLSPSTSLKVL